MIRQSEGAAATAETKVEERPEKTYGQKDNALWAPTGWVHVEKDIDFSDPKVIIKSFKHSLFLWCGILFYNKYTLDKDRQAFTNKPVKEVFGLDRECLQELVANMDNFTEPCPE